MEKIRRTREGIYHILFVVRVKRPCIALEQDTERGGWDEFRGASF